MGPRDLALAALSMEWRLLCLFTGSRHHGTLRSCPSSVQYGMEGYCVCLQEAGAMGPWDPACCKSTWPFCCAVYSATCNNASQPSSVWTERIANQEKRFIYCRICWPQRYSLLLTVSCQIAACMPYYIHTTAIVHTRLYALLCTHNGHCPYQFVCPIVCTQRPLSIPGCMPYCVHTTAIVYTSLYLYALLCAHNGHCLREPFLANCSLYFLPSFFPKENLWVSCRSHMLFVSPSWQCHNTDLLQRTRF